MKRNDVMIPFNIDQMTVNDMQRAVRAVSAIMVRWHAANEKRLAP